MNPVQEFFMKAQNTGSAETIRQLEARCKDLEMAKMKAEGEAAELRETLAMMQQLKDKYQLTLIDIIGVLERHGLVK